MNNKKKPKNNKQAKSNFSLSPEPWISMSSAVIIIAITSVGMGVLTAMQVIPVKGWLEGILWGLLYGGLIWVIFFGYMLINRFLKR